MLLSGPQTTWSIIRAAYQELATGGVTLQEWLRRLKITSSEEIPAIGQKGTNRAIKNIQSQYQNLVVGGMRQASCRCFATARPRCMLFELQPPDAVVQRVGKPQSVCQPDWWLTVAAGGQTNGAGSAFCNPEFPDHTIP